MYQNTDESLRLINDYESKKRKGKKKTVVCTSMKESSTK